MTIARTSVKGRAMASMNRTFGRLQCATYRATGGRVGGRTAGVPVLLLTTTGRRTGRRRTVPLVYWERDGDFVVSASNAGHWRPAWYHNLVAEPQATVQVRSRVMPCSAHLADATESRELWAVTERLHRRFSDYPARSGREIDMVVLHPEVS